jgi:hypothetical protein
VPDDVYAQLYRELAASLKNPGGQDDLQALPLKDAILVREAFHRALVLAGVEIDLARADAAFTDSGITSLANTADRRATVEAILADLVRDADRAVDLFDRAVLALARDPIKRGQATERALDAIVNDTTKSRQAFESVQARHLVGERCVVTFFEAAFEILNDLGGDDLSNSYFNLLAGFIDKFSLRYDLRRPCTLCPTLPGVFASLVRDLRALCSQDSELNEIMKDFEEALRDLRFGPSSGRIKTCITKQVMLLEALASMTPNVRASTLGDMCGEIVSWPHPAVRESLKKLYGFTSDCSGIRHGKSRKSSKQAERTMEMRDMVAMSILLAGFTPYLSDQLDADVVYRRG